MQGLNDRPLEVFRSLTEAMLVKAREGDWDAVAEMEQDRSALLGRLETPGNATAMAAALQSLVAMNAELVDLSTAERDQLSSQLGQLRSSASAARSYQSNE